MLELLLLVRDDCSYERSCPHCAGDLGMGYYVLRASTVNTLLERAIGMAKAEAAARELTRESEALGLYEL